MCRLKEIIVDKVAATTVKIMEPIHSLKVDLTIIDSYPKYILVFLVIYSINKETKR